MRHRIYQEDLLEQGFHIMGNPCCLTGAVIGLDEMLRPFCVDDEDYEPIKMTPHKPRWGTISENEYANRIYNMMREAVIGFESFEHDGTDDRSLTRKEFCDNIEQILRGSMPSWKLIDVEIHAEVMILTYQHDSPKLTMYVEIKLIPELTIAFDMKPTSLGFSPRYLLKTTYKSTENDTANVAVYEFLGHTQRKSTFSRRNNDPDSVYLEVEELCNI